MTKTWKVYTLDVWGNPSEGYEVNDRSKVGTIETSDEATDAEIWANLIEAGIAKGSISHADFDWLDESYLCINDKRDGMPVFQLEYA